MDYRSMPGFNNTCRASKTTWQVKDLPHKSEDPSLIPQPMWRTNTRKLFSDLYKCAVACPTHRTHSYHFSHFLSFSYTVSHTHEEGKKREEEGRKRRRSRKKRRRRRRRKQWQHLRRRKRKWWFFLNIWGKILNLVSIEHIQICLTH